MKNSKILMFLVLALSGLKIHSMEEIKVESEKIDVLNQESLDKTIANIFDKLFCRGASAEEIEKSKADVNILKNHYELLKKYCNEYLPSMSQDCVNIIADYAFPSPDFIDLHQSKKMIEILKKKIKQREQFNEYTDSEKFLSGNLWVEVVRVAIKSEDYSLLEELIKSGANISDNNSNEICPLELAVLEKSFKMIEFLLSNGADPNMGQKSALPIAISVYNESEYLQLLKLFIKYNANLNIQSIHENQLDVSPLMYCALEGYFDCVRFLVQVGADVDIKDHKGDKASVYAEESEHHEIRDYLRAREKQEVIN